jgi:hypothetical protein
VKILLAFVAIVAVSIAIWRGLSVAGITLPPDAVRLRYDYGAHDFVLIVAHGDERDVPLRSYYKKLTYFKSDQLGVSSQYSEWVAADSYSIITRDRSKLRMWRLSDSDLLFNGGWPLSEKKVSISTPDDAESTQPTAEYLRQLGLGDEEIAGET